MSNPNPQNQFKPGNNANPKGRPKREWTWAGLYQKAVEEKAKEGKGKVKDSIARKLAELADRGDVVAIKELANRMDGMPTQAVDHTTKGEKLPTPIYGGKAE